MRIIFKILTKMINKIKKQIVKHIDQNMTNRSKNIFILLIMVLSLSSCYTSRKLDYLQSNQQTIVLPLPRNEEYKVRQSDVLDIRVQSRDPEQTNFFNIGSLDNGFNQANQAAFFRNHCEFIHSA